ncbi:MAG: ATP-binding cassette domain-containing protein [Chloroflexota bacterium]
MARLGIDRLASRDPARLSGGQMQLVAIAGLLAMRPRHLVLDEPTAQLDPAGTTLVADALASLAADSTSIDRRGTEDRPARPDQPAGWSCSTRVPSRSQGPRRACWTIRAWRTWACRARRGVRLRRAVTEAGLDARVIEGRPVTAVTVEGLVHVYPDGDVQALDGIGLHVEAGETVALVGQNRAASPRSSATSTGCCARPRGGSCSTAGRRPSAQSRSSPGAWACASRTPTGRCSREASVRRVSFEASWPRADGRRSRPRDRRGPRCVGLTGEAGTNPYDLGYSRRKLLATASVLAMGTPIVVLDEPTTGQDARGVARIADIVGRLTAEGRTVIAISHDMTFVAEHFRRVVALRAGRVVLDGSPTEVFAEASWPTLASTYLEPPFAAVAGARLGLGSTPTIASVVRALRARAAS